MSWEKIWDVNVYESLSGNIMNSNLAIAGIYIVFNYVVNHDNKNMLIKDKIYNVIVLFHYTANCQNNSFNRKYHVTVSC